MSDQAAQAFIERAKGDEAFRHRVMAIDDVGQRMALIRAQGFDCTADEIQARGHPLSDVEMDRESGGGLLDPEAFEPCFGGL